MKTRASLLGSFGQAVRTIGLLDRFQDAGVIATWWGDSQNDLCTITARSFLGLVEAWETSVLTALADAKSKDKVDCPGGMSKGSVRPDITLFINGIPVVVVECKSPAISEPLASAID